QYLIAMVEARMPKDAPATPPADGPETAPPADGTTPESPPPGPPPLSELKRAEGSIGNIETGEVLKITDPDAAPGEDETYLPNATVIRYWKDFVLGTLEAPPRTPLQ